MEQKYDLDRYLEDKKLESQKQALDALNRALSWGKRVGITIFCTETRANGAIITLENVSLKGDKLVLKEGRDERSQSKPE